MTSNVEDVTAVEARDTGRAPSPATRVAGVITIGFQAPEVFAGQGEISGFPGRPSSEELGRLVDAARRELERYGRLVIVYPEWSTDPALQHARFVRASLGTMRIASYGSPSPPLAGGILAAMASALARQVPSAGALVAALPVMEREIRAFAWLGSVSGLSHPSPSLLQHLISLFPGTSFAVSLSPEPSVRRLTKNRLGVTLPVLNGPVCLAVARADADASWVERQLGPALGLPPVKRLPPSSLSPAWWGTTKLVEAVAYPVDLAAVARRVTQGLVHRLCRWCGESIASEECPFCGVGAGTIADEAGPP